MAPLVVRKKINWLEAALAELAGCREEAIDEGLEEPSEISNEKAQVLIKGISELVTDQPYIYPMDEGSIAIDFRIPSRVSGILFVVYKDGAGVCFTRTQKSKSRIHADDAVKLLDEGGYLELKRLGFC